MDTIDRIFRALDTDFSGKLSNQQIRIMNMMDFDPFLKTKEFTKIIGAADLDGTGFIDSAEFRGATMLMICDLTEEHLR